MTGERFNENLTRGPRPPRRPSSRTPKAGVHFRNQVEEGPGGTQILIDDPDGNPIELHQPPRAQAR